MNLLYSKDHEWAEAADSRIVRIGITDFAQSELGDIVFVELPETGTVIQAGDSIGTIESVKTVSDLFTPVSGTIVRVNEASLDQPELVNNEPYAGGWIVEVEPGEKGSDELAGLLTAEQYKTYIDQES
ncbi:glycine cleavage system protein GcvH [Paenibacillus sp. P26]|nr:glycine cleavage system protein GcvH [Paenibacillus sp. P26]